jgi:hypothetical protein
MAIKRGKKRKSNMQRTLRQIDTTNGRIEEIVEKTYFYTEGDRTFIKVYDEFVEKISNDKIKGKVIATYFTFASFADRDNKIIIDKELRDKIGNKLEICQRTFERHMKELIENDYLIRISKGKYMINPLYLGRGKENKMEKLFIEYNNLKKEIAEKNNIKVENAS